jgi:hypothetical protein
MGPIIPLQIFTGEAAMLVTSLKWTLLQSKVLTNSKLADTSDKV